MNATYTPRRQEDPTPYRRAGQRRRDTRTQNILSYLSLLFLPVFLFVCEFMLKIALFGSIGLKQLFYIFAFSFSIGLLITLFIRAFSCGVAALAENKDVIRPLTGVLVGIVSLCFLILFLVQFVYFKYFGSFFLWSTISMAGDITQYYREIFQTIAKGWYWILLFMVPVVLYILFPAKKMPSENIKPAGALIMLAAALICHFGAEAVIHANNDEYSDKTYYTELFDAPYSVRNFGLLAETKLDFKQLMFGEEIQHDSDLSGITNKPTVNITTPGGDGDENSTPGGIIGGDLPPIENKEYGYNVMEIDFDSLIANEKNSTIKDMHEYFSQMELASKQNRFTGYFKGKNLIFITLEGFSHKVIDPELTPTLYKIANNGFVFENFYNSMWGGSTATGEYAIITGNFYKSAKCIEMSASTYQPFALGNVFSELNYKTTAYHNHTYTYYKRHLSHPNFGYDWVAVGNGLELPSKKWPNSDLEMSQVTVPKYVSSDSFHTYYMTVSGHALYNWYNSMSAKHRARVQHLNYSENVKAYIACQLEVEDMLTDMMAQLEAAGKLDDTVFVISEDHYPYALAQSDSGDFNRPESLAELYGLPNDSSLFSNFDLYRNFFSIYCSAMKEPIYVKEPCSAIDILPTVLNLFGIEYDSRLITGTDVLDEETPNFVVLNQDQSGSSWNWITRYGSYSTATKKFTPAEGISFQSEQDEKTYVANMNALLKLKRQYSWLILEKDYYSYLKKYI